MRRTRHSVATIAAGVALMLTATVLSVHGATADPDGPGPDPREAQPAGTGDPAGGRQTHTVTLLTGDRVTVTTVGGVTRTADIQAGPGRSGVAFAERETADGGLQVVPSDAARLLAAGRVDPRLFDVTGLIQQGYDDASAEQLPLIVQYDDGVQARRSAPGALARAGAAVERELPSIRGAAVQVPKDSSAAVWEELTGDGASAVAALDEGVSSVLLDGRVRAALDESVPLIGVPPAWEAGFTGAGVRVAVLDSGIDAAHPDVADAVVEAEDFTEDWDGQPNADPADRVGHGTHVASIVGGDGSASEGRLAGVAPDAELLVGKVLDDFGDGYESWIIAGMEWAAEQQADVVNLSLGGCATDGMDPMSQAVNALSDQSGALFVVAAGNHPTWLPCIAPETVSSPAAADRALAVGSVNKEGELSAFSNTGPRLGDGAIKPELTAPGESIVAARATDTLWDSAVDDHYARLSGTSMAAPHVAGVAALVAQQHPEWSAAELVPALLGSAVPRDGVGAFQQGAGRVDAARAVAQEVFTTPARLNMGVAEWPHDDDEPIERPLTYRNTGDVPVTLELSVTAFGRDGDPAPGAMFAVSQQTVSVPAGGEATVMVTADTSVDAPDGDYSGWVGASVAGTAEPVVVTPIGVVREVEKYDLTIEAIDRNGEAAWTEAIVGDLETADLRWMMIPGEPVTLRLPAGMYDLNASIFTFNPDDPDQARSLTLTARPELDLDRDLTVVLDARDGRLVEATVESETARPGLRRAFLRTLRLVTGIGTDRDSFELYATPTAEVTAYDYAFGYQSALAEPVPASGTLPRGYHLHLTEHGRIPDPSFRVRDSELARLDTTLHSQGIAEDQLGTLRAYPFSAEGVAWGQAYDVWLPSERIDLYSADASIGWASELAGPNVEEIDYFDQNLRRYRAGQRYDKRWNSAPLGPVARPVFAYGNLWIALSPHSSSSPGNVTYAGRDGIEATTTLTKDGELIGSSDDPRGGAYELPAEPATYEVHTKTTRDVEWSALGTEVEATWQVTAGPSDGNDRLPFLNVRARGDVDLLGRAPSNRPFRLALEVERADGAKPKVRDIGLEVSFDDGASWQAVTTQERGDAFTALVPRPPSGSEFVSLRASVEDTDGSRLDQTVIRAYQLAR